MRYALVKDTKIVNVAIGADGWKHPDFETVPDPNSLAQIDGIWDGDNFLPPPLPEPEPLPPVTEITMRQCRLQLLASGLLDDVEEMITQADRAVQIEWEYSNTVRRDSALVNAIGNQLGLTEQEIDQLFTEANKL